MRKVKLFLGLFLLAIFMVSCSKPTLEDDARKAAYLTKQSMEYSMQNDFQNAESNYREVQKIMDKYRSSEDFEKFHETYNYFLQDMAEEPEN